MPAHDDVEEFAALLRGFKARTDRSYGSLARRLGMNTSTLHRYCAGDTVPLDFAPVERFAALCGATPQERLDLHRRWLLASAARQRHTARQAAPVREADRSRGGESGACATAARERPAADVGPGSAPGQKPLADKRHVPSPPPPEPSATAARTKHAPVPGLPLDGARHRRWYHPRRLALAAGLASVVLAALVALRPNHEGGEGGEGGEEARSARPTDVPAPLAWAADSHAWALGCGHDYVIRRPPDRVPPPPAPQDAGAWAAAQDAVHGRETNIRVSVQGRTSTAVVLEALRVRVVGRSDPAPGTAYAMDQGCGGALTPRHFAVNLDAGRPLARPMPGNDAGDPLPAVGMPYRVSAEDPEVLLVNARTGKCDCSWYLELDWSSRGRTGTVRIDDGGRPFRTTAVEDLPRYAYDTSARRWTPYAE
ncbi:helix-turn-helix domain-containing protein [Streptomyces sp. NPDC047706]|uniref:helix-turn-helix domain-containing protein n=1 Tax=Streptomyces sp. NPDC047706 TaxID=3365486 RepID=UPI0037142C83